MRSTTDKEFDQEMFAIHFPDTPKNQGIDVLSYCIQTNTDIDKMIAVLKAAKEKLGPSHLKSYFRDFSQIPTPIISSWPVEKIIELIQLTAYNDKPSRDNEAPQLISRFIGAAVQYNNLNPGDILKFDQAFPETTLRAINVYSSLLGRLPLTAIKQEKILTFFQECQQITMNDLRY